MPPKKVDKKSEKGQQKAEEKKKQKIAEDKTFGLKNKNKSKAVQKFIKGVQAQAKPNQKSDQQMMDAALQQKEEKKKAAQQDALLASLFKGTENVKSITVQQKKTDPKGIREEQKIDLYVDQRAEKKTMEGWDQEKLEEVIKTKHGAQNANATDIICKYFLDAVEKRQYGWFWTCPGDGDNCKYRHCLPPGYVLKSAQTKEVDEDEEEEPLEEIIERERAALPAGGTPVTLESLKAWKLRKEKERQAAVEAKRVAESKKTGGRGLGALTGRDLFIFDPTLFVDDECAASEDDYEEDEEGYQSDEEEKGGEGEGGDSDSDESEEEEEKGEKGKEGEGTAGSPSEVKIPVEGSQPSSSSNAKNLTGAPIQRKDLFVEGDVPDDLDDLDD